MLYITKENFEEKVLKSKLPVLIDFYADWCGPCKMVAPIIEELASELSDTAVISKLNVDDEMELAQMFGVQSIPTLIVMENGKVKAKAVGFKPKSEIIKMLK